MKITSNLQRLVATLHGLIMTFNSFYGFITKKSWFDYLYLGFVYTTVLHWTFFKNECFITYLMKKMDNKKYVLGEDLYSNEMQPFLGCSNRTFRTIVRFHFMFMVISICLVVIRNHLSLILLTVFATLAFIQMYIRKFFLEKEHFAQELLKYLLLFLGIVCLTNPRLK